LRVVYRKPRNPLSFPGTTQSRLSEEMHSDKEPEDLEGMKLLSSVIKSQSIDLDLSRIPLLRIPDLSWGCAA
jgi:hypothetical protein